MAWKAALKEAAIEKKKKRAEKARRKHGKEMEIARRVRADENRSHVERSSSQRTPRRWVVT